MVAITDSAGGCDRFFLTDPGDSIVDHVSQVNPGNVSDHTIGHCKNDRLPVDAKTTVQARLEYRGELGLFGLEAYTLHYRGREFNVVGKNADEATRNAIKMIHGGGPLNVYGKVGPNEEVILTPPDGQKVTISGAGGAGSGQAAGQVQLEARLEYVGECGFFGGVYTLHYRGREFNVVGKNAEEATRNAITMIYNGGPFNIYGKVGPNEEVILASPDGQKVKISGAGGAGSGHAAGQAQMEERFTFAGVTVYTVRYGGQEFTVTGKNVEEAVANAVDYIRDMGRLGFFNNVNTNESVVLNLPNGGQKEITL